MDRIYRQAYKTSKLTGIAHEVDHIIPLRGKNVCGLWVLWNRRIITHAENSAKITDCFLSSPETGGERPDAYSDDVAQSFRLDVAHRSDLLSPSVPG